MSQTPRHENDTTPFGFGDAAPVKREAPPLRLDKYDGHPDHDDEEIDGLPDDPPDDDSEDEPRPRRKRKKKKVDLLQRLDREPEPPWARVPLIMVGVGLGLCLIPLVVLVAQAGAVAGILAGGLLFLGVLVQIALMAGVMFGVGILFGIDYGPVGRALLKLAAVIALVDGIGGGLGLAFYAGCGLPGVAMAICIAAVLTYALVQTQFELTAFETLVSVMGVMMASTTLSAVAAYIFLAKMAKKAAALAQ
jgi:hypothetical protein